MERWQPLMWGEEQGQIIKSVGPFISKRQEETKNYCYRRQFTSTADKGVRARSIQARMANRKVYLPTGADWVEKLVYELMVFPAGKHDDQVDVMSLFGRMLNLLAKGKEPDPPPDPNKQSGNQP